MFLMRTAAYFVQEMEISDRWLEDIMLFNLNPTLHLRARQITVHITLVALLTAALPAVALVLC
jgi:hypothetical protein